MHSNNNKMFAAFVLFSLMLLLLNYVDSMDGVGSSSKNRGKQAEVKLGAKFDPKNCSDTVKGHWEECEGFCNQMEEKPCKNPNTHMQMMRSSLDCKCQWKKGFLGFGGSCVPSNEFINELLEVYGNSN